MTGLGGPQAEARRGRVLAEIARVAPSDVSGEALAAELGCSRTAVHRHIESLRRLGVDIVGTGSGYRLGAGSDPVVAELIRERLDNTLIREVNWVAETGSTNDDAAQAARAGAPTGTVFGADHQLGGRGRIGRRWESAAASGLLFSVILRPDVALERVSTLPIVVALAVADGLPVPVQVAWPNDLVIGECKLAGVLVETVLDEHGVQYAIAGIGINIHGSPAISDVRWPVTCLDEHVTGVRRSDVLVAVLSSLMERYRSWCDDQIDLVAEFARRDALLGLDVTIDQPRGQVRGAADGIDDRGRLCLRQSDGGHLAISSGEARLVRGRPTVQ